jgi:hypothetical protein
MLVLRLGISDRMNTERIKIPMAKSKTQTKVYLISLGVYGLSIRSLLVHSQGGQVLEKRHHNTTNTMIIRKMRPTIM